MVPIIITIIYFVFFSLLFGMRSRKKLDDSKSFFTAAGQMSWLAVMCTFTLSPLGGGHTSSLWEASATIPRGLGMGAAWWGIFSGGLMVPIFLLWFGPMFRRLKVQTFPQALGKIFGPKMKIWDSCVAPAGWLGITMSELLGISTAVYVLSGAAIPFPVCVLIAGILNILYILFGGLLQASQMNIVNAIVLIVGSFFAVFWLGGSLPAGFQGIQEIFDGMGNSGYTNLFNFTPAVIWGQMVPCAILCVFSVSSEHVMYQPMLGAKSVKEIRKGALSGGIINAMACIPFVIMGVTAAALPAETGSDVNPFLALPNLVMHYLPSPVIGILMVALLCALLSTSSGLVMSISHVINDDLLRPVLKGKPDAKQQIWITRIICIIITAVAAIPALRVETILTLFFWCFSLSLPIFVNYLIGMWWKINRTAAWINLILSMVVNFWWTFAVPSWCPPDFTFSFYPVFVVTVVLGIVLNLVMPGEKGMLRQIKDAEMAA
ncbi:MAG: hypothetical protein LBK57_08855 [Clostridiales Family XIII bacterium]|jgi:SSS family solute:Na+ symporter|nr:hypothetical protein [Clostridiales Family XIII bacterium]